MKTLQINIYQFSELSEDAKQKATQKLFDINVYDEWWDSVYYDAKNIGLKITGFDLDRANYCNGNFLDTPTYTASKIISEHGEHCETYKTAKAFIIELAELVAKYSNGIETDIVADGNEYEFDSEADELETEFLNSLLEDYKTILKHEYEYLTSEEAIMQTIEANEYEFTEDGNRY
jgi:hypothetical protein